MVASLAELNAAVLDELRRADDPVFVARLPRLIKQAEQQIERDLRVEEREASLTITTTAGVATVALPADFYIAKGLARPGYPPLRQMTIEAFDEVHGWTGGAPRDFAVWAGVLSFGPTPDGAYDYRLRYYKTLPRLAVTDAHAAFLAHWDVWFYAVLTTSAPGLVDDERLALWAKLYEGAIAQANGVSIEGLNAAARTSRAYGGTRP